MIVEIGNPLATVGQRGVAEETQLALVGGSVCPCRTRRLPAHSLDNIHERNIVLPRGLGNRCQIGKVAAVVTCHKKRVIVVAEQFRLYGADELVDIGLIAGWAAIFSNGKVVGRKIDVYQMVRIPLVDVVLKSGETGKVRCLGFIGDFVTIGGRMVLERVDQLVDQRLPPAPSRYAGVRKKL